MSVIEKHYRVGRLIYGLVPIIAGLDKFTNLLVDWSIYLSPSLASFLPFEPHVFMMIVGVIEIAAGALVLSPYVRIGGMLVTVWLVAIAANLVIAGYYDIAIRDLVMAAGAYHVFHLAQADADSDSVAYVAPVASRERVHS